MGFFSHVDPGGVTLVDRLHITSTVRWNVAQNLGYGIGGASTPAALVQAWMNSAEHRANILYGPYRQIGIAIDSRVPGRAGAGPHVHNRLRRAQLTVPGARRLGVRPGRHSTLSRRPMRANDGQLGRPAGAPLWRAVGISRGRGRMIH